MPATELNLGAAGGVAGARGIIEKTMAIVLGPVISTPKPGSLQAKQRPSSFLTSWGCAEVTSGSLAKGTTEGWGSRAAEQVLETGQGGREAQPSDGSLSTVCPSWKGVRWDAPEVCAL